MFDNKIIYEPKGGDYRYFIDREDLEFHLNEDGLTEADVDILPISEASPKEYAELIGEELESENYHSLTAIASNVLEGLQREGVEEELQLKVLGILGAELLSNI